jgi:pimeloyl-ACP methyl ester carboxylesterase
MAEGERTGRLASGDVNIFYRAYGAAGRTPILCLHGANYFDSYDWVGVCQKLAGDRETASFDKRGFGETTWSPSKDYSLDANMGDMLAATDKLGWNKPIVLGHSASGRLTIAYAANFPERISRLVVVDSGMARDEGGPRASVGHPPMTFETVDAAMAHFAKLNNPPRISRDRGRAERALVRVANGFMLKRDPDFQNALPQGESASLPRKDSRDVWAMLAAVKCPILVVRGLKSDRWTPEILERMQRDYPNIEWATVDSQHDVPFQDPDGLVAAVRKFVGNA